MNAPTLDHVSDTVQDVAHKVADRAPELATAVGRSALSTAETVGHAVGRSALSTAETVGHTVSDAVVKLAQKTPFLDAPAPRHRGRSMFRLALVVTLAGLAMWMVTRRRPPHATFETDAAATANDSGAAAERRYANAGH